VEQTNQFLRRAAKPLSRLSATVRSAAAWARRSGGAVGIAGISRPPRAHAALRGAKVFFGNKHRRGDDKILREDGRRPRPERRSRESRDRARRFFFKPHAVAAKAKTRAAKSLPKVACLYQRNVRMTSTPTPEGTSDPPQRHRGRIGVLLLGLRSWLGSCFGGFLVETSFQIRRWAARTFFRRRYRREQSCWRSRPLPDGPSKKSFSKKGEIFCTSSSESFVQGFPLALGFAKNFADKIVRLGGKEHLL